MRIEKKYSITNKTFHFVELEYVSDDNFMVSRIECTIIFASFHSLRNRSYYDNAVCHIGSLVTDQNYRNMGYATKLLEMIKQICLDSNIRTITLDDCSDNFNTKNNVYVKNGFSYVDEGFPEMIFRFA
jgi:GNAT superfamily N-acetyltransferase